MIADPEVYQLFIECHRRYRYENGVLVYKVRVNSQANAGDLVGSYDGEGYLQTRINNARHGNHRLIFLMFKGYLPVHIDHRNSKRDDNRIENLRPATVAQNNQNVSITSRNKSGFKGVYWHSKSNSWYAKIRNQNKRVHVGIFDNPLDAHMAACRARDAIHGEFANHG